MLVIDRNKGIFKIKEIWFSDKPFDVENCDNLAFYACKDRVYLEGFKCDEYNTSIVDLTYGLDSIWGNMSSGNCRKPIRRAERASVEIRINEGYEEFYKLYHSIRKVYAVDSLSIEEIRKYATLFVAELNGQIISGHGYLEDEDNIRSWVIGSRRFEGNKEYATMVANTSKLIIWSAIQYAHAKGIKRLDMGGIYAGKDLDEQKERTNTFKQSFGGKLTTLYIYQRDYSTAYKLSKKLQRLRRGGNVAQ